MSAGRVFSYAGLGFILVSWKDLRPAALSGSRMRMVRIDDDRAAGFMDERRAALMRQDALVQIGGMDVRIQHGAGICIQQPIIF